MPADLSTIAEIDWDEIARRIDAGETAFSHVLKERFPAFAWATEVPELNDLLTRAVDEEWTPETFDANFRSTDWYTTRTEAQRQFDIDEQTDPASVAAALADEAEVIRGQANRLFGETAIGDDIITELARRSVRSGMSESELAGALLDSAQNIEAGEYTAAQTGLRDLGRQHMTSLSQEEVDTWTRRILTGDMTIEGVGSLLRERSKSRFPALSELIDQGVNLSDYFGDHRAKISEMMGVGLQEVDLVNDDRWSKVLGFADGAGKLRPMTVSETAQYIRTTNDYYRTAPGKAEAAGLKRNIATALGAAL